jgi:hypothetical protein
MKISITRQSGQSLTDLIDRINLALRKQFRQAMKDEAVFWYPEDVQDDAVIARSEVDGKTYKIPWSLDGEEVKFADPVEVEEQYVEVSGEGIKSVLQSFARIKQAVDGKRGKWRFQIMEFGLSGTRHLWHEEVVRQGFSSVTTLDCFIDHPTETELKERPERSIREKIGWWSDIEVTRQCVNATLNVKPSADWVNEDLAAALEAGKTDFYGASVNCLTLQRVIKHTDGKPAIDVQKIIEWESVDLVTKAAAGGKLKHALASNRERLISEGAETMNKKALALLFKADQNKFQLVRQSLVTARAEGVTDGMDETQLADCIGDNVTLVEQAINLFESIVPIQPAPQGRTQPAAEEAEIPFERLPQVVRQSLIRQAIEDSELPEAVMQSLRGQVTATSTLDQMNTLIESTRGVLALVTQSGQVNNGRMVIIGTNSLDKVTIGLAKAFNLTREQYEANESEVEMMVRQSGGTPFRPAQSDWDNAPQILSIRRLYVEMTGDEMLQGRRTRMGIARQSQTSWQTSDFPDLMSNLMNKSFLAGYRENDFGVDRITTPSSISDFKDHVIVVLGYFGDLSTVAENAEYTTLAALSDDKETMTPVKKGNTVDLTLETIANDDLHTLGQVPAKMGRSARRTLAKIVWKDNLFSNPTLGQDSLALFHASHNNLITTALGTPGLREGAAKLLMQTEPGSSEKFGFSLNDLTLAIRSDLELEAMSYTDFNQEGGGNADALARLMRGSSQRVKITPVGLPFLDDSNDWILAASKNEAEIVRVGYWMGNKEPEFYELMGETHEKAINNDVITRHKVRFIFAVKVVDFRPVVKSVVTGS